GKSAVPQPGAKQVTNNPTLKKWLPQVDKIDELLKLEPSKKIQKHDQLFEVRVAYQMPVAITRPGSPVEETAYPYTFEDALAFENIAFFSGLSGSGLIQKFKDAISQEADATAIGNKLFVALQEGKKAEFALDLIIAKQFETLKVPRFIGEGLE